MSDRPAPALHAFAVATAALTFCLLFAGGLVTSTASGLAVPDWPLSFGQVLPDMTGGVLFEHSHRLLASLVGVCTVTLGLWLVVREPRPGVRALALLAVFGVVVQGVLGGVTVLYKLPLAVSVAHACLAQVFFCLTVTLAMVTSSAWDAPRPPAAVASRVAVAASATTALVFSQIVLGALVRHLGAGLAIPDFPLAFGRLVPPFVTTLITVNFAHRVVGLAVALAIVATAAAVMRRHAGEAALRRPAVLAVGLVTLQIALGALTIWSRRAVIPTTAHQSVGAAVLAACLVLAIRTWRWRCRPVDAPAALPVRGSALA
jgi:cytochrome c oxidase assembly protein subunit 15